MAESEMVIATLVMMAADSGELDSVEDVDIMISEMAKSDHKDTTYHEVVNALFDLRSILKKREPVAQP